MTPARFSAWQFVHPDLDAPDGDAGLRVAPGGGIGMVGEDASIRQAILLLLTTMPGERIMRPEYGCELFTLVFSPNDETTAGLGIHYVRRAVARWEPRIQIERLDAGRDASEPGLLNVILEYRVKATQRTGTLVVSVDLTGGAR